MLSPEELERYARHIVLHEVGGPGQAALKAGWAHRRCFTSLQRGSAPSVSSMMTRSHSRTCSAR